MSFYDLDVLFKLKSEPRLSPVQLLTSVIPAMQETEIGKIMVQGQLGKKLMQPHLNQ
jgi:hypothetical protein